MNCPECGNKTRVIDTLLCKKSTRRRRVCSCGQRFSTREMLIHEKPGVITPEEFIDMLEGDQIQVNRLRKVLRLQPVPLAPRR